MGTVSWWGSCPIRTHIPIACLDIVFLVGQIIPFFLMIINLFLFQFIMRFYKENSRRIPSICNFVNRSKSTKPLKEGLARPGERGPLPLNWKLFLLHVRRNMYSNTVKGSLHRFEYRNFCVNVYTCISIVRP